MWICACAGGGIACLLKGINILPYGGRQIGRVTFKMTERGIGLSHIWIGMRLVRLNNNRDPSVLCLYSLIIERLYYKYKNILKTDEEARVQSQFTYPTNKHTMESMFHCTMFINKIVLCALTPPWGFHGKELKGKLIPSNNHAHHEWNVKAIYY